MTNTPEWLDEDDVRRALAGLRELPGDGRAGLFGPDSMFWEVNKHAVVYFTGAVHAVQMQLAHPWIAVAVREHSGIMSDPRQRARLTYRFLWSIIYGDMDLVAQRSLGLHKLHSRVSGRIPESAGAHAAGSAYAANEAHAMLWVHVTAFYTRVRLYEQVIRPLTAAEKDRFCAEAVRYALCFGIPAALHPATWADVETYVGEMQRSDVLATTRAGLEISRFLRDSIPRPLRTPFWALTSLAVPARTRALLELPPDTAATRRQAARMRRLLWLADRMLPRQLAWVPAHAEAQRRLAGKEGPGWLTARLNTLLLGVPRLVS